MDFLLNQNVLLYLTAYLLAAVPFGFILAKVFAGVDVRKEGSGNIGATNVLRVLKEKAPHLAKKLTIVTFILDALKGAVVILIAMALGAEPSVLWTIAVLSVLGHCFSPFLGFEGGKGVATGFGVLLIMQPLPALIAIAIWFIAGKVLKISSLSSLIGLVALLISSYIINPSIAGIEAHTPIWIIAFVIFYKHIPNIIRVFNKEETKVI
ncbi:MAG: Acyl-phosphate:glycerol-3-phosphate O-acyltransferase PlsY [uncultured Sulfurovum sp.]|uniref:Glycerol-3-phosphate acyltransferase n=1 Tax=uncultured Sulfurovum sp. TaxID=269237 RepID=A0A6S6S9R4_9BACT|nr:MAG: Acyl-phosphate:glycerol-3-phosphate O-acyltransferase PlsY [uncultured Sulfurovum sp.]